jgi:hypothetical protein
MGYIGWAWYMFKMKDGQDIVYSGGNTNGHASFIAFNPSIRTGVVILLNDSQPGGSQLRFGTEVMMAIDNY